AYIRTALGQFSFALVILKIFTSEFYSIGALFAIYGSGILITSLLRRQQGNTQFFSEIGEDGLNQKKFRTSGNVVEAGYRLTRTPAAPDKAEVRSETRGVVLSLSTLIGCCPESRTMRPTRQSTAVV
ncbi:MAG: hypothetical protein LQ349_006010, partial [Xanthoria aureola]